MRLRKAASYGVYAMVFLAKAKNNTVQGDEIGNGCDIPRSHLMKILQQLVKARLLSSERGPRGGFSLLRTPEQITLLQIVEAIDGTLSGHVAGSNPSHKKVKSKCDDVAKYARSLFGKTTLRDLLK